jgi:hypothetical protein
MELHLYCDAPGHWHPVQKVGLHSSMGTTEQSQNLVTYMLNLEKNLLFSVACNKFESVMNNIEHVINRINKTDLLLSKVARDQVSERLTGLGTLR